MSGAGSLHVSLRGLLKEERVMDKYGERGPARFRPSRFEVGRFDGVKQRRDERIREEVCERLMFSHSVDPGELEVNVSEGLVTLDGIVEDRDQKRLAEELIEDLPGVKRVHNHLSVRKHVNGWVKGLH